MRHRSMTRALIAGAIVAGAVLPSTAAAAGKSGAAGGFAAAAPAKAKMTVTVDVVRFRATNGGTVAEGKATARLRGLGGLPTTVTKKVRLSVARQGSCKILTLVLDQLDLTLLGLNVHLDKVDLRVTGRRRGGVLGSLFCSLANAKVKLARAAAAAALTSKLRRSGGCARSVSRCRSQPSRRRSRPATCSTSSSGRSTSTCSG